MKTKALSLVLVMFCAKASFSQDTNVFQVYLGSNKIWNHDIALHGQAVGGSLYLTRIIAGGQAYVRVDTQPGESATAVMRRLAPLLPDVFGSGHGQLRSSTNIIGPFAAGDFAFGGTESGFGIPEPPTSFSGRYDSEKDEVIFRWMNPPSGYDALIGVLYDGNPPGGIMRSNETSFVYVEARDVLRVPGYTFNIVGFKGLTPSNAGVLNVTENAQEELSTLPFYRGITPNWASWVMGARTNEVVFEQGQRPCRNFSGKWKTPDGKPFYQIVKTKTADVQAGIWRKWLGLVPEHKYRVYVRLNTLAMDQKTNDWSLSFHVAPTDAKGTDFTTDQFTGKDRLPDGSQGPEAARMALYGPKNTTRGQWVTNTVDIDMPPGVDTLTTWLRHSGQDSTGVGMDWIKVEDLSYKPPTNALPLKPSQPSGGLDGH